MSAYRDDVAALDARHTALSAEVAEKTRELADASRLLDEARKKARLPVLDNIRVASPCSASWDGMTGDARVRHCAACDKHVYNLSNLTREEAQALILEKEGKLCARYYQRTDGTILLADCSIGVGKRRRRRVVAAGVAALLAGTGTYLVLARREPHKVYIDTPTAAPASAQGPATQVQHEEAPPHHEAVMGDMAM